MEAIKGSKFPIGQLSVASKACLCLLRLIYTIFRKFIPFSAKLFHFARYYSILRDIIPFCASLFHFARVYSILHRVIPFHAKLFQFAQYFPSGKLRKGDCRSLKPNGSEGEHNGSQRHLCCVRAL